MRAVRRILASGALACVCVSLAHAETPSFSNVTLAAGITHVHGYLEDRIGTHYMYLAGVAAGDYDNDGWTDLYVIRGGLGPNLLYRNRRDGTFEDVASAAGVAADGHMASGPLFFDANSDGTLDLFVAGTQGTPNHLFIANGDGTFTDRTVESHLAVLSDTFSASAADYDRDGDLDLFLAHWGNPMQASHLWRNDGHGVFTCVDGAAGIHAVGDGTYDYSFTGNFCDLNNDGWPDIVMAGDFETSRVFLNRGDGTFADATASVITDENGMGAAAGDYDNDGDMDWFVSSIFDATQQPNEGAWGYSGNRMYRNRGDGSFDDATDVCGVREGGWGWGSSFADFNNDGWLDLYQVNGWPFEVDTFLQDPSNLFMNDCNGGFLESSEAAGCASTAQGRGVVCFDYDNDGDIDIFVSNYRGAPELWRNDGAPAQSWLNIALHGGRSNVDAIGARVTIEAGGITQTREVSCGNNYLSQNPAAIHVGLGASQNADRIVVRWPNGETTTVTDVDANQRLIIAQPAPVATVSHGPLRIVNAQPNPFRDLLTLRVEGMHTPAVIVVYDVAGRRVREMTASNPDAHWNGRDDHGVRVPSGVYWIRVSDATASAVRRVVLVR